MPRSPRAPRTPGSSRRGRRPNPPESRSVRLNTLAACATTRRSYPRRWLTAEEASAASIPCSDASGPAARFATGRADVGRGAVEWAHAILDECRPSVASQVLGATALNGVHVDGLVEASTYFLRGAAVGVLGGVSLMPGSRERSAVVSSLSRVTGRLGVLSRRVVTASAVTMAVAWD